METSKLKIIKDYEKLSSELLEQLKLEYPNGFYNNVIQYTDPKSGKLVRAVELDTEDKLYMIRLPQNEFASSFDDAGLDGYIDEDGEVLDEFDDENYFDEIVKMPSLENDYQEEEEELEEEIEEDDDEIIEDDEDDSNFDDDNDDFDIDEDDEEEDDDDDDYNYDDDIDLDDFDDFGDADDFNNIDDEDY